MRTDASLLSNAAVPVEDGWADLEGVRLHYVTAGDGPLVVLVHGFPDFWFSWRHQIVPLAEAGFRVVAVDTRGYNLSTRPPHVRDYGIKAVAKDIADLIVLLGEERAHIVGHDVGAGVTWTLAMTHPERVDRLAFCNGAHPANLLAAMKDPVQLAKSWYVFMFQLPWFAEQVCMLDSYKLLLDAFRNPAVKPGSITREDLAAYEASYKEPGTITAMLSYYRAMFRPSLQPKLANVDARVLSIWGVDDPHLGRELATPPSENVPNAKTVYITDASHWVHQEQPAQVNQLLLDHLA